MNAGTTSGFVVTRFIGSRDLGVSVLEARLDLAELERLTRCYGQELFARVATAPSREPLNDALPLPPHRS